MLANLRIELRDGVVLATASGEVDASNSGELTGTLIEALSNTDLGLILDLEQVEYFDSSGVHMLFDVAQRMRRRQMELWVVAPPDSFIGDILKAVNTGSFARLAGSVDEAVSSLSVPSTGS